MLRGIEIPSYLLEVYSFVCMYYSHFSFRIIKKKVTLMIKNARHLFFLGVFSVMVVQPQHFVVDVPFGSQSLDSVHASYAQLIEQTQQQDGVLIYDTVSVDEDRQTSISYQVAP